MLLEDWQARCSCFSLDTLHTNTWAQGKAQASHQHLGHCEDGDETVNEAIEAGGTDLTPSQLAVGASLGHKPLPSSTESQRCLGWRGTIILDSHTYLNLFASASCPYWCVYVETKRIPPSHLWFFASHFHLLYWQAGRCQKLPNADGAIIARTNSICSQNTLQESLYDVVDIKTNSFSISPTTRELIVSSYYIYKLFSKGIKMRRLIITLSRSTNSHINAYKNRTMHTYTQMRYCSIK